MMKTEPKQGKAFEKVQLLCIERIEKFTKEKLKTVVYKYIYPILRWLRQETCTKKCKKQSKSGALKLL